ncbi:hypothetical protein [Chitinophaga sancti]|uniref:hypothetical protein n=1 Tax=Chitinophaga sancti TaxID=1004 RepID=UPI003F79473C
MTFFNPAQLRVLKSGWIMAILAWLLLFIPQAPGYIVNTLTITGLLSWEFAVNRRWKDFLIMVLVSGIAFSLQHVLMNHLPDGNPDASGALSHLNLFAAFLVAITTHYHLMGIENKFSAGLLATAIFYLLPKTGNPFSSNYLFTGTLMKEGLALASSLILLYMKIVCYYVILFLVENGYRLRHFTERLPSKVQVYTRWEYLFMWMMLFFTYMGCIGDLSTRVRMLFEGQQMPQESTPMSILFMIASVFFLYVGALMLRNVITGRALTIGHYSPWMLLLHLLPVVNIIAAITCFFAPEKRETHKKNAASYLQAKREYARKAMIVIGLVITAYNIYTMLFVPTGLRLVAISILAVLYLLKIGAYLKLTASKTFVYIVVILNILTVAYAFNDYFIFYLALIYLYYYFLIETFYPELEAEDIMEISDRE